MRGFWGGVALVLIVACSGTSPRDPVPASDPGHARRPLFLGNGLTVNGIGGNGIHVNGIRLNGIRLNGIRLNGIRLNGLSLNGIRLNGIRLNGLTANGIRLNGIGPNGIRLNGIRLNGLSINGLAFNGIRLNGIRLNGIRLNGLVLDDWEYADAAIAAGADQASVEALVDGLVRCALPEGQTASIRLFGDASPTVFAGELGYAPEWKESEATAEGDQLVSACIQAIAETDPNVSFLTFDTELTDDQKLQMQKVLKYMVECALVDGDSIEIDGLTYYGALGLAPDWKEDPPTLVDQRKVSACLAARTNANGQTVQISLRGSGLAAGDLEQNAFDWHEGGFWADLFGEQPFMRSCKVNGGISGRVCAEGEACGFEVVGDCDDVCDVQGADGAYRECGDDDDRFVINTFMNLKRSASFGSEHSCVTQPDGSVFCFGNNSNFQRGIGYVTPTPSATQRTLAILPASVAQTSMKLHMSFARLGDGRLYSWGSHSSGCPVRGHAAAADSPPAQVTTLGSDVNDVAVADDAACATTTDGSLYCWGCNDLGQLGTIATTTSQSTPVEVTGISDLVADIGEAREDHFCAVGISGNVWCWGKNDAGRAYLPAATKVVPGRVTLTDGTTLLASATDVCTGDTHSCARKSDGTVWCWGANDLSQLGNNAQAGSSSTAHGATQTSITDVRAGGLECGANHTCAVKEDGTVWCWGLEYWGIGDGTWDRKAVPAQVKTGASTFLTGVDGLAGSDLHTCARQTSGAFYCWGYNQYGTLGADTSPNNYSKYAISATRFSGMPYCDDGACNAAESAAYFPAETAAGCPEDCDPCTNGATRSCGTALECSALVETCVDNQWGACAAASLAAGTDCQDGAGECDGAGSCDVGTCGVVVYTDSDDDGYVSAAGVLGCDGWSGYTTTPGTDCQDELSTAYLGADESCNGVDDDCDGYLDEGAGCACVHPERNTGVPLEDGCSACVTDVCAEQPYCCTHAWDESCVHAAKQLCDDAGSCAHPETVPGDALADGCSACVTQVCDADDYCCTGAWDSACIDAAEDLCGMVVTLPGAIGDGEAQAGLAATTGSWQHYHIDVPANATMLAVVLEDGDGDADLYVRYGDVPTDVLYDYRPYLGGNDETVEVASPAAGRWYVSVRAHAAFTGVSLTASVGTGTTAVPLTSGVAQTGIAGGAYDEIRYYIDVPANSGSLAIATTGGTGEADLYVRLGSAPTTSSYDHRPYLTGNAETVNVATPTAGRWYVTVQGRSAFAGVSLTATVTAGPEALTSGVAKTGISGAAGQEDQFYIDVVAGQSLTVTMSGGTGNGDLYLRRAATPTTSSYHFRSTAAGNTESYSLGNATAGRWYVTVYGTGAYSGVSLTATLGTSLSSALQSGTAKTGLSGALNSETVYTIDVPAGSTLSVTTSGGTGDPDLYVKFGSAPTTSSYDGRSWNTGPGESLSFSTPSNGRYYVMIKGYSAYTGLSLTATAP